MIQIKNRFTGEVIKANHLRPVTDHPMNTTKQSEKVKSLVHVHLISGSTMSHDGCAADAEVLMSIRAVGVHHTLLPQIITHAVNCHESLLEACKTALQCLDSVPVRLLEARIVLDQAITNQKDE